MMLKKTIKRFCKRLYSRIWYAWRFYSWGKKSSLYSPDCLHNPHQISIGQKVEIRKGARLETFINQIHNEPKIEIGDGTIIQYYFHCGAAHSIKIGKNVLIASRVYITDHDHIFNDPNIPPIRTALVTRPVIIEDEVWIGEGAAILKGVHIGRRSVIGANSVVTKDIPPHSVVGGIPAKIIKTIKYS